MKHVLRSVHRAEKAHAYITECLSQGGQLPEIVLKSFHPEQGRVFVLAPPEIDPLPESYREGGVSNGDDAIQSLAGLLHSEIVLRSESVIFIHSLARKGDPILSSMGISPSYCGETVCFLLNQPELSVDLIHSMISKSLSAFNFIALIVPRKEVLFVGSDSQLDANSIARGVAGVIVGVFDNETFLLWRRDGPA